jgi:exodeoxyribonuclease VII large subunit
MDPHRSRDRIKLSELNSAVRSVLLESFPDEIWVIAEISELKVNQTGHCYLELIEKDEQTDRICARARANIWSSTYRMLDPYFENTTGYRLSKGIKILILARVEFHELYGYSLTISDIDPTYTLGDLAKKRMEIIAKLEKDGVINMNRELPFPLVPGKIAIISSETAAGYLDFIRQLDQNSFGYRFFCKLFQSVMQGEQAEESIINALGKIFESETAFDVVVIIRGGGSKSDLACFDNYNLAFHVAQFPVPVLTGIGHEQDETITDLVAHKKLKTPTAVAEYIINSVYEFESQLTLLQDRFILQVNSILATSNARLKVTGQKLISVLIHHFALMRAGLTSDLSSLKHLLRNFFNMEKAQISTLAQVIQRLDPVNILRLGYSYTIFNGQILTDARKVVPGEEIHTTLKKGYLTSIVSDSNISKKP